MSLDDAYSGYKKDVWGWDDEETEEDEEE